MAASNCKVVSAAAIAKPLLARELAPGIKASRHAPRLHGFLANKDPGARMYADWTAKTCKENGVEFTLREVDPEDLEDEIRHANTDDGVDGILIYYPVFDTRRDQTLQWTVSMYKDVEGLSPQLISNMYQNIRYLDPPENSRKSIVPCTPLAIIKILEHLQIYNNFLDYGKRLFGRRITVINRSEVIGRPLAALLANDGAEVYSVDITGVQQFSRGSGIKKQKHEVQTLPGWGLEQCLPISEVVISGVPGEKFKVPAHLVRDGAVCINFSSEKNFDADIKEKASIYVPSIGKVTIVVLMRNLLRLMQSTPEGNGSFALRRAALRAFAHPPRQLATTSRVPRALTSQIQTPALSRQFHQSWRWLADEDQKKPAEEASASPAEAEGAVETVTTEPSAAEQAAEIKEESIATAEVADAVNKDVSEGTSSGVAEKAQKLASDAVQTVGDAAASVSHSLRISIPRISASSTKAEPVKILYIGNLFFEVTSLQLEEAFSPFGQVKNSRVVSDGRGLSKGFGYVEFADQESADNAIQSLDQKVFHGRRMAVQYHVPRDRNDRTSFTRPATAPSKTLFIGNMSYQMSDRDLNDLFREVRNVLDVRVAIDRRTGQPRGFAHADFIDAESAQRAKEYLEKKVIYERQLRIDFSEGKGPRDAPV